MSKVQEDATIVDWITSQSKFIRYTLGLTASAILACYIPHLLVAATGQWINNLTMWGAIGGYVAILVVQGLIGVGFKKPTLTGIIFGVIWLLYFGLYIARTKKLEFWQLWWMVLFVPTLASVLNGWLMDRYSRMTGLLLPKSA